MPDRRFFLKQALLGVVGALELALRGFHPLDQAWASVKRLLPKGTDLKTLVNENPAHLDARNLAIQPLEQFGTMGLSDHPLDLTEWRLEVNGRVGRELRLTYGQVRAMPFLERPVLLICPGFFANHGRWRGVSFSELAKRAKARKDVTHVTVSGPAGPYEKTFRFPWRDALSGKAFLAYQVNGEVLPVRHGFPLRLVAEGVYGSEWVKYVSRVQFDKIEVP